MSRKQYIINARQAQFLEDGRDAEYGPRYFNQQKIQVYAEDGAEAMDKAEKIYGHKEVVGKDGRYVKDEKGVWTEMDIESVKELEAER